MSPLHLNEPTLVGAAGRSLPCDKQTSSNTLYHNHAFMSGFAFWLHVNSDSAISNILVQRSFQAGSRVITVADSMLEEVINLKR